MELAKNNNVWFISAPYEGIGSGFIMKSVDGHPSLKLVDYKIVLPEIFKFKIPSLYKRVTEKKLSALLKKLTDRVDWVIDFGCYQFFNSLDFADAHTKIYFPVDDFGNLTPMKRGADKIFSVSTNIVDKFNRAGLECFFINHGLSGEFAELAQQRMQSGTLNESNVPLKFGYSGNLFIRFLDIPVIQQLISENPGIEFHFFGNTKFDTSNEKHVGWWQFLQSASNVKLHGFMSPENLAHACEHLDGFLLCYKPDYKDYHAENSHKVFEYLSTGKVMVSTYLSLYQDSELICMSPKDANGQLPALFKKIISQMQVYNSPELQWKRIAAALDNTYQQQAERIAAICSGETKVKASPAGIVPNYILKD